MVIQRWQSVFLLAAAVLMGFAAFVSFGNCAVDGTLLELTGMNRAPVGVTSLTAAVLLLVDIFLFNNFKRQKTVLGVGMLLSVVTVGLMMYYDMATETGGFPTTFGVGLFLAVAAIILTGVARRFIVHDERLLKSYDRLR